MYIKSYRFRFVRTFFGDFEIRWREKKTAANAEWMLLMIYYDNFIMTNDF